MVITEFCYSLRELDAAFMRLAILNPVSWDGGTETLLILCFHIDIK